jgi:hypothetical protein
MGDSKMPRWAQIVLWPPILVCALVLFVVFAASACLDVFRHAVMTVMQPKTDAIPKESAPPDVAQSGSESQEQSRNAPLPDLSHAE